MNNLEDKRPEINYPNDWKYKIIGDNIDGMLLAVDNLLLEKFKYDLSPSNISKKGNYFSLNLIVTVNSEDERNFIYTSLNKHENIKMVL